MKVFQCAGIVLASCSFLLFGCGVKDDGPVDPGPSQLSRISCIGVLPAASLIEGQVAPVYFPEKEDSRRGIEVMNEILSKELGGKDKIRFVGLDQITSLELTGGENSLAFATQIGRNINCNAVLESTVKRFTQRDGGRYSVEAPASVAFEMRLIFIDDQSILWSAQFDEVQKSVMENLLEWGKANTRGFVWITAEELMREGVREKFADSPYFNPVVQ